MNKQTTNRVILEQACSCPVWSFAIVREFKEIFNLSFAGIHGGLSRWEDGQGEDETDVPFHHAQGHPYDPNSCPHTDHYPLTWST